MDGSAHAQVYRIVTQQVPQLGLWPFGPSNAEHESFARDYMTMPATVRRYWHLRSAAASVRNLAQARGVGTLPALDRAVHRLARAESLLAAANRPVVEAARALIASGRLKPSDVRIVPATEYNTGLGAIWYLVIALFVVVLGGISPFLGRAIREVKKGKAEAEAELARAQADIAMAREYVERNPIVPPPPVYRPPPTPDPIMDAVASGARAGTTIGLGGIMLVGAVLALLHFRPRRRSPAP